jgi:hypothetical protein
MEGRVLSARASRVFYNVADALVPPAAGDGGGGDVDLVPFVERSLRGQGGAAVRRAWLALTLLEWWPILTLRARRGFSRAPRERRRELLGRWRGSRLPLRRHAVRSLETLVAEALESHAKSRPQVPDESDQSEEGA